MKYFKLDNLMYFVEDLAIKLLVKQLCEKTNPHTVLMMNSVAVIDTTTGKILKGIG